MNLFHACRFVYSKAVRKGTPLSCFSPTCPRSPLLGYRTEFQVAISFFHFSLSLVAFMSPHQSSGDVSPSLLPQERLTDNLQDLHCILVAAPILPVGTIPVCSVKKIEEEEGWSICNGFYFVPFPLKLVKTSLATLQPIAIRPPIQNILAVETENNSAWEQPTSSLPSHAFCCLVYMASTQGQICTSYLL